MNNDKVSKAIMFYYDSNTKEYKPIDELSGAESLYKYIPKVELYWFDETSNGYKPLVTDGKLPVVDGGGVDPSQLEAYALKTYVDDKISTLSTQIGAIYSTQSYVTTEIGKLEFLLEGTYLKKADANSTYATKTEVDSAYLKKSDATSTYLTKADGVDKLSYNGIISGFDQIIGNTGQLMTNDKSSLVNAINEVVVSGGGTGGNVDLSSYATKTDLDTKVDKVTGKQLSTNDYTTAEKSKLSGISAGANNYTLPIATSGIIGGVKIANSAGLEITAGGTLSATALKTSVDNHIADSGKHVTSTEKAKIEGIGNLSDLTTTNKLNLVSAINEVKSSIGTGGSGSGNNNLEINVKDYGAIGDGVTDDTVAIQNALTFAKTNKNKVVMPAGRYKTTNTLTVYTGTSFEGMSAEGSIIEYNGSGVAVKFDYDMRDMAMRNFTIQSTNHTSTTSIGLLMEANLFCNVDNIRVLDFSIGYKLDGKDKWCASNYIYNPFALRCDTGMLLTADEGKQTNHTIVIGGYIVGHSPIQTGAKAVVIEQGDSNKFFGTAVEDYDVGFHFKSENAGGNSLISPRVENCTTSYLVEPNTVNTTILDPFGGVEEANIQSDSFMFLSLKPTFKADNLIWANNVGLKFQSSGRTDWEVFKVTQEDGLEFTTPSWFGAKVEFKIADEANIHQPELTIEQGAVKARKYLFNGSVEQLPTAEERYRGSQVFLNEGLGKRDRLMTCIKLENESYVWSEISNSQHLNVKDFGAIGDGIADDTLAIQSAIDNAKNYSTHSSVFIPKGTFIISSDLILCSDLNLYGEGASSIIKIKDNSKNLFNMLSTDKVSNYSNITIRDLTVDGNKDNQTRSNETTCVQIWNCNRLLLSNLIVKNSLIEGAYIYKCTDTKIDNCTFTGNGFFQEDASGLHLDSSTNSTISNCSSYKNGFHGIILTGEKESTITNCIARENGYDGFKLQYSVTECVFNSCISKLNTRSGFYLSEESTKNIITNAMIDGNRDGLVFSNSVDNFVLDTIVTNASFAGIENVLATDYNYGSNVLMRGNATNLVGLEGSGFWMIPKTDAIIEF